MYDNVGVFCFCCGILGHRSIDCTILVGGGSKCKVLAVTGEEAMQEDSVIVENGVSEVMKEDGQKSPSKVHIDGHMAESLLLVKEGKVGSLLYGP